MNEPLTFLYLAKYEISRAAQRAKTINLKIGIGAARTMIVEEEAKNGLLDDVIDALTGIDESDCSSSVYDTIRVAVEDLRDFL